MLAVQLALALFFIEEPLRSRAFIARLTLSLAADGEPRYKSFVFPRQTRLYGNVTEALLLHCNPRTDLVSVDALIYSSLISNVEASSFANVW